MLKKSMQYVITILRDCFKIKSYYDFIALNNIFLQEFVSRVYNCKHCLQLYILEPPILFSVEQCEQALVVLYSSTKLNLQPFIIDL